MVNNDSKAHLKILKCADGLKLNPNMYGCYMLAINQLFNWCMK